MALVIAKQRSRKYGRLAGAFLAVSAFIIQGIVPLNVPAAFADDSLQATAAITASGAFNSCEDFSVKANNAKGKKLYISWPGAYTTKNINSDAYTWWSGFSKLSDTVSYKVLDADGKTVLKEDSFANFSDCKDQGYWVKDATAFGVNKLQHFSLAYKVIINWMQNGTDQSTTISMSTMQTNGWWSGSGRLGVTAFSYRVVSTDGKTVYSSPSYAAPIQPDMVAPAVHFVTQAGSYNPATAQFQMTATDNVGVSNWKMEFHTTDGTDLRINRVPCTPQTGGVNATATCFAGDQFDKFTDGQKYVAYAMATDAAGNVGTAQLSFTADMSGPVISITTPTSLYSPSMGTITANATDPSGIGEMHLTFYDMNGIDMRVDSVPCIYEGGYRSTKHVSCSITQGADKLQNGKTYIARFFATDATGNVSTADKSVTIDTVGPTVTLKTRAGETAGSDGHYRYVSYKLFDDNKVDKITINGVVKDLTDAQWSDVNDIKPGTFGGKEGDNEMAVYDVAGNQAVVHFVLDTNAPTGGFTYSPDNNTVKKGPVTVTLTASEPIATPDGWTKTSATTFTKVFADNVKGSLTIADLAGNTSKLNYEVKRIDNTPPVIQGVNDGDVLAADLDGFTVVEQSVNVKDILVDGKVASCVDTKKDYIWTCSAITGDGTHTITVTDKAGNVTTVAFTIQTSDTTPTDPSDPADTGDNTGTGTGSDAGTGSDTTDTDTTGNNDATTTDSNVTTPTFPAEMTLNPVLVSPFTPVLSQAFAMVTPLHTVASPRVPLLTQNTSTQTPEATSSDTASTEKGDVLGTKTVPQNLKKTAAVKANTQANFFGLAWYWWLIVAGAVLGAWWIVAARRRRDEDEA